MRFVSQADRGNFRVRGFTGPEGSDHVQHLIHLADWYRMLPIAGRSDTSPATDAKEP